MKRLLFILFLIGQSACISTRYIPVVPAEPATAYLPQVDQSDISRFMPIFLVEKSDYSFNRIGTPSIFFNDSSRLHAFVNPDTPSVYVQKLSFKADKTIYKNYVYRIHFEEVPFSLMPFYLTSGKNVGLIIVITINEENDPVLITTVHTCGCYLGFVPTSFLQKEAFPDGWNSKIQRIYGERLPGLLDLEKDFQAEPTSRIVVMLESGTHRVKWIKTEQLDSIKGKYQILPAHILPMEALKSLGNNETDTSFFETSGPRKGYVKGSYKFFERILMSWWVMDLHVGEDKDFGHKEETGTIFYTSLKFWDRKKSDMWNFNEFLSYWGWKF